MKKIPRNSIFFIPAILLYSFLAYTLRFVQDDSYITYRYVANFLNGHGLVYNIGERVEGFTNFGWTIYLCLVGALGFDYILVSQLTGFLFGGGVIVLTYLIADFVIDTKGKWFVWLPVYLVAANMSLAYWSPAGLETAAFAFFAMLILYWFLKRSHWMIFSLLIAVWIRPEGALVALILLVVEAITERRLPRFTITYSAVAFILSLPYLGFKLSYYGSILPNPFYAKTGFDTEQLLSGLEYTSRFMSHYGFWGIGLVIPLFFFRHLSSALKSLWLVVVFYTAYIVLVGGDVLKVHRFFLPLFGLYGILIAASIWYLCRRTVRKTQYMILVLTGGTLLALTLILPGEYVRNYNVREKIFTKKMGMLAGKLKESDNTNFSVALSTIGRFGYELIGHDIIDMLGLTDSAIARHPGKPVPGLTSTWKERKQNVSYLLQRAPDYIYFSTGIKPSAPAEQALVLCPAFQQSYRTVGWSFVVDSALTSGRYFVAFKRMRPVNKGTEPSYPVEFVQLYKKGLDSFSRGKYADAITWFNRALKVSPKPYYIYLVYYKAFCHLQLKQDKEAIKLLNWVLQQDSLVVEAHRDMYTMAAMNNDRNKMILHRKWLQKLVPWYLPRIDSLTNQIIARARKKR